MSTFSVIKDPQAVLDYALDWGAQWLGTDTITTSEWTVTGPDTDLKVDSSSFTDGVATVWISGGTLGETYSLTNHIVTSEGREDDRTIEVRARDK